MHCFFFYFRLISLTYMRNLNSPLLPPGGRHAVPEVRRRRRGRGGGRGGQGAPGRGRRRRRRHLLLFFHTVAVVYYSAHINRCFYSRVILLRTVDTTAVEFCRCAQGTQKKRYMYTYLAKESEGEGGVSGVAHAFFFPSMSPFYFERRRWSGIRRVSQNGSKTQWKFILCYK